MARKAGRSWQKTLLWLIGIAAVLFVVIQFIPYGRSSHSNPPATNQFTWTDPKAEAIARTACYDCHSNETKWWWATNIAPFSWLVQHDVNDGRARLNFSEFDGIPDAQRFAGIVNEGEMPPMQYALIHPSAKLSPSQQQTLIQGYVAGLSAGGASAGSGSGGSTPAPSASTGSATADATAVIRQDCSSCHAPDPALAFRAGSAAEANSLIDAMVQQGAQVSPQDRQVMVQYFTR